MSLTDTKIRQSKPKEKLYKLSDEKGLYLEIAPAGGKWWRLKFRVDGKEKRLSLGSRYQHSCRQAPRLIVIRPPCGLVSRMEGARSSSSLTQMPPAPKIT